MEDKLQTAQEAAIGFVKRLRLEDLAQVIDFDSRVLITQSFTSNVTDLEEAIRQTTAGGSTSLYNAIYIALKELKKVQARNRRRRPTAGDRRAVGRRRHVESRQLRRGARAREAIRDGDLRHRHASAGAPTTCAVFNEADFVLRQLSQETGGRVFFARGASELSGIYEQIADELSSQYTIGYTSKNPEARWRVAPRAGPREPSPTSPRARNRDTTRRRRRQTHRLTNDRLRDDWPN